MSVPHCIKKSEIRERERERERERGLSTQQLLPLQLVLAINFCFDWLQFRVKGYLTFTILFISLGPDLLKRFDGSFRDGDVNTRDDSTTSGDTGEVERYNERPWGAHD